MSGFYYHVTPPLLSAGSVIENGNFGSILEKYSQGFGDMALLYREEVFEFMRKEQYPDKPSRFKSIFLLDGIENAVAYRDFNAKNQNIYKVKIIDSSKQIHKGCWCPPFPAGYYRQYCFDFAKMYWESKIEMINIRLNDSDIMPVSVLPVELIVESPVEVLERVGV